MKLKKFLSVALALAMSLSLSVPAFAVDDEHRTEVVFDGTGEEEYFLTVPASLPPAPMELSLCVVPGPATGLSACLPTRLSR